MLTFSETVLNLTIWSLTGAGLFFGGRAAWRRRRERRKRPPEPAERRTDQP